MAASYPSSAKSFTTKSTDETIEGSHVNDLQDEVTAIETALLTGGLAHNLLPSGTRTIGTSSAFWDKGYLTALILGAESTSGVRVEVDGGIAAFREGDDSADASVRVLNAEVTGDVYTVALTDYSATSTIVGWTTPTAVIKYKKVGKLVFVAFRITGTSNSTSVTFTVPYTSANNGLTTTAALGATSDNSASAARGSLSLPANSSTVTCNTTADGSWTSSGTKIVGGQFWYEAAS